MTVSWKEHLSSFWRDLFADQELLTGLYDAMSHWLGLLWDEQAASQASDELRMLADTRRVAFWPLSIGLGAMQLSADGFWRLRLPPGVIGLRAICSDLLGEELLEEGLDFELEPLDDGDVMLRATAHLITRFARQTISTAANRTALATCEEGWIEWGIEDSHLRYVTDKAAALTARAALRRVLRLSGRMRTLRGVSVIETALVDPSQSMSRVDVGRVVSALAPGTGWARILSVSSPGQALLDREVGVTAGAAQVIQERLLHSLFAGSLVTLEEKTGRLPYLTRTLSSVSGPLSGILDQGIPSPAGAADVMFPCTRSGLVFTVPAGNTRAAGVQVGWYLHASDAAGNHAWGKVVEVGSITAANWARSITVEAWYGDLTLLATTQLALSLHRAPRAFATVSAVVWSTEREPAVEVFLRDLVVRNRGVSRWDTSAEERPVQLQLSADYARALHYLMWGGPTKSNIARAFAVAGGVPLTRDAERVVRTVSRGSTTRVITEQRAYDVPTVLLPADAATWASQGVTLQPNQPVGSLGAVFDAGDGVAWAYGQYLPSSVVDLPAAQRAILPGVRERVLDGSWVLGEPGATLGGDAAGDVLTSHVAEMRGVWNESLERLLVSGKFWGTDAGAGFYALGVLGTLGEVITAQAMSATWTPPVGWHDTHVRGATWTTSVITFTSAVTTEELQAGDVVLFSSGLSRAVDSRPSSTTALLVGSVTAGSGTVTLPMPLSVLRRPALMTSTGYSIFRRLVLPNIMAITFDAVNGGSNAVRLAAEELSGARPAHAVTLVAPYAFASDALLFGDALADVEPTAVEELAALSPLLQLEEGWSLDGFLQFFDGELRYVRSFDRALMPAVFEQLDSWHTVDIEGGTQVRVRFGPSIEEASPSGYVEVWESVEGVWGMVELAWITTSPEVFTASTGSDGLFAFFSESDSSPVPLLVEHDGSTVVAVSSTAEAPTGYGSVTAGSDLFVSDELHFFASDLHAEVVLLLDDPSTGWTARIAEVVSTSSARLVDAWTGEPFEPGLTSVDVRAKITARRSWGQVALHLNGQGDYRIRSGGPNIQELPLELTFE